MGPAFVNHVACCRAVNPCTEHDVLHIKRHIKHSLKTASEVIAVVSQASLLDLEVNDTRSIDEALWAGLALGCIPGPPLLENG